MRWCCPHSGWIFPPQVKLSETTFTDMHRGMSPLSHVKNQDYTCIAPVQDYICVAKGAGVGAFASEIGDLKKEKGLGVSK